MSAPKRQKIQDGSYITASTETTDSSFKPKSFENLSLSNQISNDPNDPLLAAYNNPYLAHMIPENGYSPQIAAGTGPLRDFIRRKTTAKQAEKAEDGPDNPFTLKPLGKTYFDILKKRRELPVHAQRHYLLRTN